MTPGWWLQAPELLARNRHRGDSRRPSSCYRFADGLLELESDDERLNRRFQEIYPEGAESSSVPPGLVRVGCSVRTDRELDLAIVVFDDPDPLDSFAFCQTLFPDRGYIEGPEGPGEWRTITSRERPDAPFIALNGNAAIVDREQLWQPYVANYAVNRVLRLQPDLLLFHAASVGIEGQGVMIVGPKGSGKTTTSMTLASRGKHFLGDEMAVVHRRTKAMLPFRRAVSVRPGLRAAKVQHRIEAGDYPVERFPDGGERVLASIAGLFPEAAAAPATLACVFFLQGFGERPRCDPFSFGMEHFGMLSPLACSMWGVPVGSRMLDLTRMLRGIRCYFLAPGPPDETAELIERLATGAQLH